MNIDYHTQLDKSNLSALRSNGGAGARSQLKKLWEKFDFDQAQRNVTRLQARIAKAFQNGQHNKVKALQGLLVRSLSARMLAVARVTASKGSRTAGVDNERWSRPASKMFGALSLWKKGYKAAPLRRVQIAKPGSTKKRALGIPTIRDRAMQALHLLALDPVAETSADPNSYGFRKFRSTHDAIGQAFTILAQRTSATWVLDADIKGCFDYISHDWMLTHIPTDRTILQQWLKCGVVETKGNLFPTTAGTPQGGIASPCLCNIVLNGLEDAVKSALPRGRKVHFVRYADDFFVTAKYRCDLEDTILPVIVDFLAERGLKLSDEKTHIRHIRQGFDFLGQNIRKYPNGKLRITPSQKNAHAFLAKARERIKSCHGQNLSSVISQLNPMIRGWANYHRNCLATRRYAYVDHHIHQAMMRFLKRSHPDKSKQWIRQKYVLTAPANPTRQTLGVMETKKTKTGKPVRILKSLHLAGTTTSARHIKIRGNANPYNQEDNRYFRRLRGLREAVRAKKWIPTWSAG